MNVTCPNCDTNLPAARTLEHADATLRVHAPVCKGRTVMNASAVPYTVPVKLIALMGHESFEIADLVFHPSETHGPWSSQLGAQLIEFGTLMDRETGALDRIMNAMKEEHKVKDESICDAPNPSYGPNGKCRCMICARCNKHTGNAHQGHNWSMCNVTHTLRGHHFCCPGNCELEENKD